MRDGIYKTYDGIKAESQRQRHEGYGHVPDFQECNLLLSASSSAAAECLGAIKGVTPTVEASPASSQTSRLSSARSSPGLLRHIPSSSTLTAAAKQAAPAQHQRNTGVSPSPGQRNASATPTQRQHHTSTGPEELGTATPRTRAALLPQTYGNRFGSPRQATRHVLGLQLTREDESKTATGTVPPCVDTTAACLVKCSSIVHAGPEGPRVPRGNLAASASTHGFRTTCSAVLRLQQLAELPLAAPSAVF